MIIIGLLLVVAAVAGYFYVNDAADVVSGGDVLGNVETNTSIPENVPNENIPAQTNTPAEVETPTQVENVPTQQTPNTQQNTATQKETTSTPQQNTTSETPVESQQTTNNTESVDSASEQIRDSAEEGNATTEAQTSEPDPRPNETSTEANNATTDGVNNAYFAKKLYVKTDEKGGTSTYTFEYKSKGTVNKNKIAKIILGRVNPKLAKKHKYAKLETIAKVVPNSYNAKQTITFGVYKMKTSYKKIKTSGIGSVVYVIAQTTNLDGKNVTIEIKEKKEILTKKALPVIEVTSEGKNGTELTKLKIAVKNNKAIKKIKLRPKADKDLKKWYKKFKDDKIKIDYLWLKVKPEGDKTEFLKKENEYFKLIKIAPWMEFAIGEKGVTEIKGSRHNPDVLKYHKVSGGYSTDEIAWCGSFVNWVMKKAGYTTVSGPAGSRNWMNFGEKVSYPVYGAIAVWSNCSKDGKTIYGSGHVSFVYERYSNTSMGVLGGNQGGSVKVSTYNCSGKVFKAYTKKNGTIVWRKFRGYYLPSDYDNFSELESLNKSSNTSTEPDS